MPDKRRKYYFNINKFIEETREKYYWLGFISGDGSIREKENRLRIELSSADKKHLEKFKNFLESNYPINERINNGGHSCVKIDINSSALRKILSNYDIVQNKTETFTLPLDKIPHQFKYDYIRGFMDADGCICIRPNKTFNLSFASHRKEVLQNLKDFFQVENKISIINNNYFISISGTNAELILNNIYKDSYEEIRLDRKYNKYCSLLK